MPALPWPRSIALLPRRLVQQARRGLGGEALQLHKAAQPMGRRDAADEEKPSQRNPYWAGASPAGAAGASAAAAPLARSWAFFLGRCWLVCSRRAGNLPRPALARK